MKKNENTLNNKRKYKKLKWKKDLEKNKLKDLNDRFKKTRKKLKTQRIKKLRE